VTTDKRKKVVCTTKSPHQLARFLNVLANALICHLYLFYRMKICDYSVAQLGNKHNATKYFELGSIVKRSTANRWATAIVLNRFEIFIFTFAVLIALSQALLTEGTLG